MKKKFIYLFTAIILCIPLVVFAATKSTYITVKDISVVSDADSTVQSSAFEDDKINTTFYDTGKTVRYKVTLYNTLATEVTSKGSIDSNPSDIFTKSIENEDSITIPAKGTTDVYLDVTLTDNQDLLDLDPSTTANSNSFEYDLLFKTGNIANVDTIDKTTTYVSILILFATIICVAIYYKKHKNVNKLKFATCVLAIGIVEATGFVILSSFGSVYREYAPIKINASYVNGNVLAKRTAEDFSFGEDYSFEDLYNSEDEESIIYGVTQLATGKLLNIKNFAGIFNISDSELESKEYTTESLFNYINTIGNITTVIINSNVTYMDTDNGKSEVINYTDEDGNTISQALNSFKIINQWDGTAHGTGQIKVTLYKDNNYIDSEGKNTYYGLIISSPEQIYANPDCTALFSNLSGVRVFYGIDQLNTKYVTDMTAMFLLLGSSNFVNVNRSNHTDTIANALDLSNFDTSQVTSMVGMFTGSAFGMRHMQFDTSNVTDMSYMFASYKGSKGLILNFNTSKVTSMKNMFFSAFSTDNDDLISYTIDFENFDTSNVTDFTSMFEDFGGRTIDVSIFNVSKALYMDNMFKSNILYAIIVGDNADTFTNNSASSTNMFGSNIVGGNGTKYSSDHNTKEYARVDKEGQAGYFTYVAQLPQKDYFYEVDGNSDLFIYRDFNNSNPQQYTTADGYSFNSDEYGSETYLLYIIPDDDNTTIVLIVFDSIVKKYADGEFTGVYTITGKDTLNKYSITMEFDSTTNTLTFKSITNSEGKNASVLFPDGTTAFGKNQTINFNKSFNYKNICYFAGNTSIQKIFNFDYYSVDEYCYNENYGSLN